MFETHPEIDGLTLFAAEPGPHVHEVHSHGAHSVIVVTSGAKIFHHCGESVRVEAGEMAISNPGDLHGCEPADGGTWSHQTWYVDPFLLTELAGQPYVEGLRLRSPVIRDTALAERLNAAHIVARQGGIIDRQHAALDALSDLARRYCDSSAPEPGTDPSAASQRIQIYEELLLEQMPSRVTLRDFADAAHISRNQVVRDFKSVLGVTPGNYERHLRLEAAKRALRNRTSLAEASALAGFADQSHFTRVFRRAYGVTPSAYQSSLQSRTSAF